MNTKWRLYSAKEVVNLGDFDIAFVCSALSDVLCPIARDVFGDALEIFRSQWTKTHGGQFFTDQRVTRLAMTLLEFDPRRVTI
jgi:type I restriction-modification system DNA methylase subunit